MAQKKGEERVIGVLPTAPRLSLPAFRGLRAGPGGPRSQPDLIDRVLLR